MEFQSSITATSLASNKSFQKKKKIGVSLACNS